MFSFGLERLRPRLVGFLREGLRVVGRLRFRGEGALCLRRRLHHAYSGVLPQHLLQVLPTTSTANPATPHPTSKKLGSRLCVGDAVWVSMEGGIRIVAKQISTRIVENEIGLLSLATRRSKLRKNRAVIVQNVL